MRESTYKDIKLNIFEREAEGAITESQRDDLLQVLEEKKESTKLTPEAIQDVFDELEEMYPDLEDDIKKLAKKIADSDDGAKDNEPAEDKGDSDNDDKKDDDDEQMSEAARELETLIKNM